MRRQQLTLTQAVQAFLHVCEAKNLSEHSLDRAAGDDLPLHPDHYGARMEMTTALAGIGG